LGLAKRTGARFLQASTSEIYGDPTTSPQHEEYWGNVNPIGIRSCYDEGKRAAETLTFDYHRQFNLDIRVARIFNTYGPRMAANDGRVVSNLIVQALKGEALTVYGDGSQIRSFCYVEDMVEGLIKLFFANEIFEPINLGNPDPISIMSLSKEIRELSRSSSPIELLPLPDDDPKQRMPDISRAVRLLNWKPKINRLDGIGKTIAFFQEDGNY
jgi:UDP-glucuronate decarboxylase